MHFPQQERTDNIKREVEEEEADSLFISSATKNAIQVIKSPSSLRSSLFLSLLNDLFRQF